MNDEYQKRYEHHQKFQKKDELIALMKERHSNRRYADTPVDKIIIDELLESLKHCPSSCDRHGVRVMVVEDRDRKDLLNGLLVGGTGWVYRAPVVFLLFADPLAYKAGDEIKYNSYLDAGIMVQQLNLLATAMGLHCAFVNPQIREMNQDHFKKVFSDKVFCGAFALGYPHPELIKKNRNLLKSIEL